MTQDKIKRIHRWYSWILAAILAVLGVLFILSCIDIFTSGPHPFNPGSITLRFRRIAVPVLIGVIGIWGGIALNLLLPLEPQRTKGTVSPKIITLRLRQKADVQPVQKEIRLRLILRAATGVFFACLMIYPLIYFLKPGHFTTTNLNADVIKGLLIALIPAIVGLGLCLSCRLLVNASYRRETAIYKQALADGKRVSPNQSEEKPSKHRNGILLVIKIAMTMLAVVFIVVGIFNGGAKDVLDKAIAICTECIGLG